MADKLLVTIFFFSFLIIFLFIFGIVINLFISRIQMFFQYKTLAKELGFDYVGSWKDFLSKDVPYPSYLTSNWLGLTTYINRVVKGNHQQRPFFYMNYQRYSYWKRSSTSLVLFVFKKSKISPPFLVMPSRLFANFLVKVPTLEGTVLNQELKNEPSVDESMPKFLSKYKIKILADHGKNEIFELLTPSLMECLLERPHWYIYNDGDWLLTYFEPDLIFPMGLRKQVDQALKIATLLGA